MFNDIFLAVPLQLAIFGVTVRNQRELFGRSHPCTDQQINRSFLSEFVRSFAGTERLPGRFRECVVFFSIGGLLIAAATSKAVYIFTDPFADVHLGVPTEVIWMSILLDYALGIANLASSRTRLLSFVNLSAFAIFCAFNLTRLALGETTCACSGLIEIPIWVTLLLDLSIVLWFVRNRHHRREVARGAKELFTIIANANPILSGIAAGFGVVILVLVAFPAFGWGSLADRLSGVAAIQAKAAYQNDLQAGKQKQIDVLISNKSDWPAKLVGVRRSCGCMSIGDDLAARTIPPHGQLFLPVLIRPRQPGKLYERLTIFVDHPECFRIDVNVVG